MISEFSSQTHARKGIAGRGNCVCKGMVGYLNSTGKEEKERDQQGTSQVGRRQEMKDYEMLMPMNS